MNWKTFIGIILIICSLAAMVYWESTGRDALLSVPILVVSDDLQEGVIAESKNFTVKNVSREDVVPGALSASEISRVIGKKTKLILRKNEQVLEDFFIGSENIFLESQSVFSIPAEWIYSSPSIILPKTYIDIYVAEDLTHLGKFRLERSEEMSKNGIEIACSLEEYHLIYEMVNSVGRKSLLIVPEV